MLLLSSRAAVPQLCRDVQFV